MIHKVSKEDLKKRLGLFRLLHLLGIEGGKQAIAVTSIGIMVREVGEPHRRAIFLDEKLVDNLAEMVVDYKFKVKK
jgi:hypothetical protein